ncbi:hypothetical protein [uncultured Prevotella sp.]|uniref:hypothetical protein n=1 Tax=uncultured Prevotella sp. TaxID=159272 RepID=UPI00261D796E|nr:hypothetical protein [uncultured Prevotella sp.]
MESAYIVRGERNTEGLQIDLIIDRSDDVANLCEMKYSKAPYTITSNYATHLIQRKEAMEDLFHDKTFLLTYIGSSPLAENEYTDTFPCQVTLDGLFIS